MRNVYRRLANICARPPGFTRSARNRMLPLVLSAPYLSGSQRGAFEVAATEVKMERLVLAYVGDAHQMVLLPWVLRQFSAPAADALVGVVLLPLWSRR